MLKMKIFSIKEKEEENVTIELSKDAGLVAAMGTKSETTKDIAPSEAEGWREVLQLLKEQSI